VPAYAILCIWRADERLKKAYMLVKPDCLLAQFEQKISVEMSNYAAMQLEKD
jgi:hypothetical protein